MRILMIILSAIIFTLSSNPTASDFYNRDVEFYQEVTYKTGSEFDRCSSLFQKLIRESKEAINSWMREEGCFDRFSGYNLNPGTSVTMGAPLAQLRLLDTLLVIRIPWFDTDIGKDLQKKLATFAASEIENVTDVVIDLTDNSGGAIEGMRGFLEPFAPRSGAPYLEAVSRCGDLKGYERTEHAGVLAGKRYTILVNKRTASASEWSTAILRYQWYPQTATIIGISDNHTFGKKLLLRENDTLGLTVTCGEWKVPGHDMVLGVGMTPDRVIDIPKECGWEYECVVNELGLSRKPTTMVTR